MYSVWFRNLDNACFISGIESYALATRIAAELINEGFVEDAWVVED